MTAARKLAVDALVRIDEGDAYANLVVPGLLARSGLDARDRAFVTALVYGTTRMRRACDWLVDRFLVKDPDATTRAVLRMGAYQLAFLGTPAHAAVATAVDAAPRRTRGLVNAVLRRVASDLPPRWPDAATELSYPDWILRRLESDLGHEEALGALQQMNEPAEVTEREDGYVQDLASQWVAGYVDAQPGDRVADLCAAPGGKATAMAEQGAALVVAGDVRESRAALVRSNALGLGLKRVAPVIADGRHPPFADGAFERVLVDAPCSGLGVLRRRPDARWRVTEQSVGELAELQRALGDAAAGLVGLGGVFVYSVCTLTREETLEVDRWLEGHHPELQPLAPPGAPWRPLGRGALLLPQARGTDGMFLLGLRRVR